MKKPFNIPLLNNINIRNLFLKINIYNKYEFIPFFILITILNTCILSLLLLALPFIIILAIIDYSIDLVKYVFKKYRLKYKNKFVKEVLLRHQNNLTKFANCKLVHYHTNKEYVFIEQSLQNFILYFFSNINPQFNTINEKGYVVCGIGRRRSVGEIFLICKHYYPECTLEEVLSILIKYGARRNISGSYCNTINKYVYYVQYTNHMYRGRLEFTDLYRHEDLVEIYK